MISIIITAYNAEKTIEKCLKSILENEYSDHEIIIVDDGSTDKTEEIINLFADEKIKYFKKENTGVADSRNYAISKAKGEYITFVDSDDYVLPNFFENLKEYMSKNIDVIKRKAIIIDNMQNQTKIEGAVFDIETGEEAFNKLWHSDKYLDTLWSYVIKKEYLDENNFCFEIGKYHEDFGILPLIILKAKTMISLNQYVYCYVQSENSIMREKNYEKTIKKANDILEHYDNILREVEKYNLNKITKENVRIYCTNTLLQKLKELNKKEKIEYIKKLNKRKVYKNIKIRNLKQLIKRIILTIEIKRMRFNL